MTTIDSPPPPTRSPATVIDVRESSTTAALEALRAAYEERWRLVAGERAPAAADADLARNAAEIAALERLCRPQPSVLVRRNGPDPSTFLG